MPAAAPVHVTPDLAEVIERVQGELAELLDVLEREGGEYAKRYAAWVMHDRTLNPPPAPQGLHPMVAKCVRELVLDGAAFRRRRLVPDSPLGAPSSAAITNTLTQAGLPAGEVHKWFATTRRELGGQSPAGLIQLAGEAGARRVLELARDDVQELAA